MAKLNPTAIGDRAREMLEVKLASVSSLLAAREALMRARASVTDAEKDEARAYAETLSAGWSATELTQLGLPALKMQRRPRRPHGSARSDEQPPS